MVEKDFPPKVEIKDYNGKIDGRSIFDQSIKSNIKHMKALGKLLLVKEMIIQLVVYQTIPVSKKYYEIITIDLSEKQALDVDPRVIQHINFTRHLDQDGNRTTFFILEEEKETILHFSQGTVKVF